MARYPKAVWRPVARYQPGGTVCREMAAYRRYCLHTAVSAGSLFNWFNTPGNAVAHFYVLHDGKIEQYVDTRYQSTANLEGNHDTISVESEDMGFPFPKWLGSDVPAWTGDQVEALAELGAWIHEMHGIPIVACPNSLHGSKGFAYHRQGIDPWRISGGEHWSKSTGKVCPSDRRVKQVPAVIARAKEIAEGDEPVTDEEITKIAKRVLTIDGLILNVGVDPATNPQAAKLTLAGAISNIEDTQDQDHRTLATVQTDVAAVKSKVESLSVGGVDLDALATKVADLLAARLQS